MAYDRTDYVEAVLEVSDDLYLIAHDWVESGGTVSEYMAAAFAGALQIAHELGNGDMERRLNEAFQAHLDIYHSSK